MSVGEYKYTCLLSVCLVSGQIAGCGLFVYFPQMCQAVVVCTMYIPKVCCARDALGWREAKTWTVADGNESVGQGRRRGWTFQAWDLNVVFLSRRAWESWGLVQLSALPSAVRMVFSWLWPVMSVGGCSRTEYPGAGIHPQSPPSEYLNVNMVNWLRSPPHLQLSPSSHSEYTAWVSKGDSLESSQLPPAEVLGD